MKKISLLLLAAVAGYTASAQDFNKNVTTARSSYSSGNLQESRFAMEQMLRDLDTEIGKEILKLLPAKVGTLNVNAKEDNVTGNSGYVGLYVQRTYGAEPKNAVIEIINNSPLITSLNAILSTPILGGMMRDENQKVVKVQGYKSLLNKTVNSETGKTNYELQIPLNNTLVTVRMNDANESEITAAGNSIQLAKIVEVAQ